MRTVFLALAATVLGACAQGEEASVAAPKAEIETLLASPETYDGTLVTVRGAALARFEANFICASPEVMEQKDGQRRCLALVPGNVAGQAFDLGRLDGRTVEAVGYFRSNASRRSGRFGGTLAVIAAKPGGTHNMPEAPPPPPPSDSRGSSPNNSSKPTPLRGAA